MTNILGMAGMALPSLPHIPWDTGLGFTFLTWYLGLVGLPLAIAMIWFFVKQQPTTHNPHTRTQLGLRNFPVLGRLPALFLALFLGASMVTVSFPVIPEQHETRVVDTRDIVIAVDFSGSMDGKDVGAAPEGSGRAPDAPYRRLDAAQDAIKYFVPKREGDRVGLFIFDDATYLHWPMTDDLKVIMTKADLIAKASGGGTNFQGPNGSDRRVGPLQAALNHWAEYGKAKTKVVILVTDGEAPISDERHEELVRDFKAAGGVVYVLGIGPDWTKEGNPSGLEPIKKLVAATGGKTFAAADVKKLQEAASTIDELQKSKVELERSTTYRPIFKFPAAGAVILLVLFLGSVVITRETA